MEFRVLGSIEARENGRAVSLGGPQQRRLLAVLLTDAGRVVSVDRLVDAVWPSDEPPDAAHRTTRTYVSRLRSALGDGYVVTREPGYLIELDGASFDKSSFEQLVTEARALDPAAAVAKYDEALAQWHGPAFAEFADEWWARPEAARLEELRLVATEERIEALLAVGRHAEAVPDLERLAGAHPYRERFTAQLMVALHRCGREADAHRAFQRFRAGLVEDTGLEPTEELVQLDRSIATGGTAVAGNATERRLRGYVLGERLGEGAFGTVYRAVQPGLGREVALKVINAELADDVSFVRRFETEAQLVSRLEHPHIVPLYDFWREPGGAYLVFRLLRGGSAEQMLAREGPLLLDRVDRLVNEVGAALIAAHATGVVHRDVKPSNVLFDETGNAYLADFGIAQVEGAGEETDVLASAGSPLYVSPEQVRDGRATARSDQYSLSSTVWELLTGEPPFVGPDVASVLGAKLKQGLPSVRSRRPDVPEGVDVVLTTAGSAHPDDRFPSVAEMLVAWRQAVAAVPGVRTTGELGAQVSPRAAAAQTLAHVELVGTNPYKGLRSFREADASDFFGRATLVDQLAELVGRNRFVCVVGPSGSGKSSLVHAGLVPRLRADERLLVASMVPGAHPLEELSDALSQVATGDVALQPSRLAAEQGIATAARAIATAGGELVLVVDQLEELWTLSDSRERDRLLAGVAEAVADDGCPLRVVVTVRADFFDRPLQDASIGTLVAAGTFGVTPLSPAELLESVVEPGARVGVRFEPGLAAELVAEVAGQPAGLPLLQFALTELYERRDGGTVSAAAHRELGGVAGAVARRADELYASLDDADQRAAQELFTRLVAIGDGADTRRRVRLGELAHVPASVITLFGDHRLLAFDRDPATREPTVEVAHEALLVRWPRLRSWIDDDRQWLALRRHLGAAAEAWDSGGREPTELYRGARLAGALDALEARDGALAGRELGGRELVGRELNDLERAFLDASRAEEEREREADRARLAAQRRANRRLRALLAGVAAMLVVALVAGAVAVVQNRRAEEAAEEAEAARHSADVGRLVASSRDLRASRLDVALLVAVEAHRRADTTATRGALHAALVYEPRLDGFLHGEGEGAVDIEFSPSGRAVAIGRTTGVVELWNAVTHRPIGSPVSFAPPGSERRILVHRVVAVWFGSEDEVIAATSDGRVQRLRAGATSAEPVFDVGHRIIMAAPVPGRDEIVTVAAEGGTQRRDAETGAALGEPLPTSHGLTADVSFSPDGTRLVTAVSTGGGGEVIEWDVASGAPVGDPITEIGAGNRSTALVEHSSNGSQLITSNTRSTLTLWDLATRTSVADFEGAHTDFIRGAAFSPDATRVATVGQDGLVVVWDAATGRPVGEPMDGQSGPIYTVAFSPDGTRIVSGGVDGSASIWDLNGVGPLGRRVGNGPVSHTAFSPDGRTVAASGLGGVQLVDAGTLEPRGDPFASEAAFGIVAFSPDGAELAVALPTGAVQRYDTATGRPVGVPLEGRAAPVSSISYSPDGGRIASGSLDNVVLVHDVASGEALAEPWRANWPIQGVRFMPDGSQVAVAVFDGTLALLDADTLAPVVERLNVEGFHGASSVAIRPGGAEMATGSGDGTVTIWDVDARRPIRTVAPHTAAVYSVAYSGDGRLLATGSTDGTARVIDADTGQPIGDAVPKPGGHASIDPDGRILAVPTPGGVVVYDLDHEGWAAKACARAGRNLTPLEWEEHFSSVGPRRATCAEFPLPED